MIGKMPTSNFSGFFISVRANPRFKSTEKTPRTGGNLFWGSHCLLTVIIRLGLPSSAGQFPVSQLG